MTTDVSTTNLKINVLTRAQYDTSDKNTDELYFVEESDANTWLIAFTDVPPATAVINDRYYNTTAKLIYTWDGSAWTNSISPDADSIYIDKSDNSTYAWNGVDMVQIGDTGGIKPEDIDNTTITFNSSDKLQASGIINKNDGVGVYNWVGTKEEYDLLEEIHDDWIYYITNDNVSSGNMSLSNVYNRLNRAYAWTNRVISGAGNVYTIYNDGTYKSSSAFSATNVIGPEDATNCAQSNFMIYDGKLYYMYFSNNNVVRTQIGVDTTWTCVGGSSTNMQTLAINNGDLYHLSTTTATLKNIGGWQKLSGAMNDTVSKNLGIKNDSLYMLSNFGSNIDLIDSSGVWTQIVGHTSSADGYMFGIKDGKLYSISYTGTVTQISNDNTWTKICGFDSNLNNAAKFGLGINNGKLYAIKGNGVTLINDIVVWDKCTGYDTGFALTHSCKLYKVNYNSSLNTYYTSQIGTDSTWTDITGYSSYSFGINNGNVYLALDAPTQLTTIGGMNKVYGGRLFADTVHLCAHYWTGSAVEDAHTVYTVPSPQTTYHTYTDKNLTSFSTITAVNMNENTITDSYYTYTRDSNLDTVFTNVSSDSKNQLISMADLLNAIKG